MLADVLGTIDDEALRVYVVWEPILRTDGERAARHAVTLLPDARVEHFWTATKDLGRAFQAPIGLRGGPAWDVYLLYPPGARWEGAAPPAPNEFMHQLGRRLPGENRFDAVRLAGRIREELAAHGTASR